jgi:two-component system chemotaxis sensor kinase CheA
MTAMTALLDEIAEALVLADASDKGSLSALVPLLEQLKASADEAQDTEWIARGKEWSARLKAGLGGNEKAARRALDALVAHVTEAQSRQQPEHPARTSMVPGPDDPAARQPLRLSRGRSFERPAWVEPEVLAEFLSAQEELTDALEAEILALESEPAAIAALRRRIHTVKGEAGVLGMDDLAQVCHALEDFLEDEQAAVTSVDLLLEVKDWITEALQGYTAGRLPSPGAAEIERRLHGKAPAAAHEVDEMTGAADTEQPDTESSPSAAISLRQTVKVDLERVDQLVELIGELVIAESMVVHAPEIGAIQSPRVLSNLNLLGRITRELQDAGMRMRMVPLRGLFQKMARLVRDAARKSDKQVRLEVLGQDTEIDRSIVECIADPIMHMIRNAVSHGIEDRQQRLTAGKPAEGTIRLAAHAEGGSIVIEVEDDGSGLDRDAILGRAQQLGLIEQIDDEERLSDHDVFNLIFHPGFSTAREVTEVSGRGVGLDVVKRSITAIRGRTAVSTVAGQGTTFRIILPLTLAIIDGMVVASGNERYIIPTLSVIESMQVTPQMLASCAGKWQLLHVRGLTVPLLRLSKLLDVQGAIDDPSRGLVVIVESVGHRVALLVDEVITQQQVVIKSLGAGIAHTRLISGGAIMSDGRVGLILNVEDLGAMLEEQSGLGLESGTIGRSDAVTAALTGETDSTKEAQA